MQIVLENISWMGLNVALAGLGLTFGWLFFYIRKKIFAYLFFVLWVLFIPNTIYLITDLQHLPPQLIRVNLMAQILLCGQYLSLVILGILTFIVGMYPVDKFFSELHFKKRKNLKLFILFLANFLIAIAVVLGKFERTHSFYVFSNPQRVLRDFADLFSNPILLSLVLLFAVVINLTYFGFKNIIHVKVLKKGRS